MSFQDGRHSILSLVCLAFLCSVFKVRIQISDVRRQISDFRIKSWIKAKSSFALIQNLIQDSDSMSSFLTSEVCSLFSDLVGLNGLEPSTSRLSGGRSNLLSYKPIQMADIRFQTSDAFAFCLCLPDIFIVFESPLSLRLPTGGDNRDRTDDPLLAKQVLSQLSYTPINLFLGLFL